MDLKPLAYIGFCTTLATLAGLNYNHMKVEKVYVQKEDVPSFFKD
jgi:hypothetical protein